LCLYLEADEVIVYIYILVLCDYDTRYPEAIPARNIRAKEVAESLIMVLLHVGLPNEVLTDQGEKLYQICYNI